MKKQSKKAAPAAEVGKKMPKVDEGQYPKKTVTEVFSSLKYVGHGVRFETMDGDWLFGRLEVVVVGDERHLAVVLMLKPKIICRYSPVNKLWTEKRGRAWGFVLYTVADNGELSNKTYTELRDGETLFVSAKPIPCQTKHEDKFVPVQPIAPKKTDEKKSDPAGAFKPSDGAKVDPDINMTVREFTHLATDLETLASNHIFGVRLHGSVDQKGLYVKAEENIRFWFKRAIESDTIRPLFSRLKDFQFELSKDKLFIVFKKGATPVPVPKVDAVVSIKFPGVDKSVKLTVPELHALLEMARVGVATTKREVGDWKSQVTSWNNMETAADCLDKLIDKQQLSDKVLGVVLMLS